MDPVAQNVLYGLVQCHIFTMCTINIKFPIWIMTKLHFLLSATLIQNVRFGVVVKHHHF
jgi:hypothetical protein